MMTELEEQNENNKLQKAKGENIEEDYWEEVGLPG